MIAIDSSSLILMAKIDILDKIIKNLKKKLALTEEVYRECTIKTEAYDAKIIKKRVEEKAILKKEIKNLALYQKIRADFNLGKGEAEAIVFCLENNTSLVTDDKKAMNACKILRIKFTTAPNLLVMLHNKKLINKVEANSYLRRFEKFGRYTNEVLQRIKEDLK